ncbi:MAG: hypothetical protein DMF53_14985 [Acidobacteria bacterium]|nr:MAG: hypothetical protein DMF53_14985 [Acidobacteriota bacterium]
MRKKLKKLALAKETVRHLEPQALGEAAGGTGYTYGYGCLTWLCVTTNGPYECANACIDPVPAALATLTRSL